MLCTLGRFIFLKKIRVWAGRDRSPPVQRRCGMVDGRAAGVNHVKPYEKLGRYWGDSEISTASRCEQIVDGLERKYGVQLPDGFRDYLIHSSPTNDFAFDQNFTTWWSLDRIRNIVEEYEHPIRNEVIARDAARYLLFADYSIWCWAWAIACGDDENRGRVAVISGDDRFVADSFSEFVDRYINDFTQVS